MLLEFSVSNLLSFNDRTTLNMIPSIQNHSNTINVHGVRVLKFAAIYGANASGKSNLVRAFSIMKGIINNGLNRKLNNMYCRAIAGNKERETSFSQTFHVNEKFYNFTFSVNLSEFKIISESLVELNPKNDKQTIIYNFDRKSVDLKDVFPTLKMSEFEENRIKTYLYDNVQNNCKLLITDLMEKEWDMSATTHFINDFKNWNGLISVNMADRPIDDMVYLHNDKSREKVSEILNELNTGVESVLFVPISEEQFIEETSETFAAATFEKIRDLHHNTKMVVLGKDKHILTLRGSQFYQFYVTENGKIEIHTAKFKYSNSNKILDFIDESNGIRRLFSIIDSIITLPNNGILIVDEIDRSLHPILAFKLIEIINKILEEKNIQLIFTTHETHILDLKLFRKDEIWFIEKDNNGVSSLYSLDIFKIRNSKIIKDGYIEGIYGGVPLFRK